MSYTVLYSEVFLTDIADHVDYLLGEGAACDVIANWYDALFAQIDGLEEMPTRCPVDTERSRALGCETRKLNLGRYVAFYQIEEDRRIVRVVSFFHGARRREI